MINLTLKNRLHRSRAMALSILVALSAVGSGSRAAEDAAAAPLELPVKAWLDAFNRWDAAYPETAFLEDAVVIDQFPSFLWTGRGSAREWWLTMMGRTPEAHERARAYHEHLELSEPEFVQIDKGVAYFVMPAKLTWTFKGVVHEMTARWIATEIHTAQGWRISSHSWAPLTEVTRPAP